MWARGWVVCGFSRGAVWVDESPPETVRFFDFRLSFLVCLSVSRNSLIPSLFCFFPFAHPLILCVPDAVFPVFLRFPFPISPLPIFSPQLPLPILVLASTFQRTTEQQ